MFSQACVSHYVHNRPHGFSVTAHTCYGVVVTHPTGMLSCFSLNSLNSVKHLGITPVLFQGKIDSSLSPLWPWFRLVFYPTPKVSN